MPEHVASDQTSELLVVGYCIGSRANERHRTHQNVEQLGQLVQRSPTKQSANRRYPRVVLRGLLDVHSIVHRRHGPKLPNGNLFAIEPIAALEKENRSDRREFDRQGGHQENRC